MKRLVVLAILASSCLVPSVGATANDTAAREPAVTKIRTFEAPRRVARGDVPAVVFQVTKKSHCRGVVAAAGKAVKSKRTTVVPGRPVELTWKVPPHAKVGKLHVTVKCGSASRSATVRLTGAIKNATQFPVAARSLRLKQLSGDPGVVRDGLGANNWAPFGTRLVAGSEWLGGQGVDVFSNGFIGCAKGCTDVDTAHNSIRYQCVDLVQRLVMDRGWSPRVPGDAKDWWANASTRYFDKHPKGSGYVPVPGDVMVWGGGQWGHVAAVEWVDAANNRLGWVEQNSSTSGRSSSTLSNVSGNGFTGYLHAKANTARAAGNPTGVSPNSGVVPGGAGHFISWTANDGTLRLSHWTGSTWQHDNFGAGVAAGSSPSSFLGPNGTHFISWVANDGTLRLSHWTGSTWQHDNFGLGVRAGTSPSSFAGPNGSPFISWVANDGTLRFSHWTGSTWQHDNFGAGVAEHSSPSAYLGPNGQTFISWVANDGTLRLLHWTGSAWQVDNFGMGVRAGTSPSAFAGPNGSHFISWVANDGTLRLSHWTGSAWQHDNFGAGVAAGSSPSSYQGPNGSLFIAWVANDGTLRLSHWTGATWQNDNFALGVAANTSPDAYLGANGSHFISWVASNGTLRLSHWTGSAWQHDDFGAGVAAGSSPSSYLS